MTWESGPANEQQTLDGNKQKPAQKPRHELELAGHDSDLVKDGDRQKNVYDNIGTCYITQINMKEKEQKR